MKKIALPTFVMMAIIFSVFAACQNSNSKLLPEKITEENTIRYPINNNINNGIYKAAVEFANSVSWTYDPAYYKIPYPNGDVPSGGACTDVIIRVLRKNNIDLQQLIHEDISSNFDAYPNKWGLSSPDANIDHRRVPNIMKYFERNGFSKSITNNTIDYQPGDIVCWELSPGITHIGIVLENEDVFHNMGPSSRIESRFLFSHKILGHYRI
jgi:uncharacterized protein YijF (DUF1287 family)